MRIGVLEWICGGGLQTVPSESIPHSLQREGKAMLHAVADGFRSAGHEVVLSIDARFFSQAERREIAEHFSVFESSVIDKAELRDGLPGTWWAIAESVDVVLVIAPEFSNILQSAVQQLSTASRPLMNCTGEFLNASCDKWLTAECWRRAAVPHPATQLQSQVTAEWLDEHRLGSGKWIIKPRDGAGCEGITVVDELELEKTLAAYRVKDSTDNYIIQPFHSGKSFSRSAIVDAVGGVHWLPLVTQELLIAESIAYRGGAVQLETRVVGDLDRALHALGSGALGWVGFDLVHCEVTGQWLVIEANPRLTTSFVGLSQSYGAGLAEQLLRACTGGKVELAGNWRSLMFDSSGKELVRQV